MINFGLNSASILGQVNVGATPATFLGIFLAVAGAALYFLRTIRPELSRDQDIFFAAVGLLCGFILIFQGWRLDPILQFGQLLLVGTTVFFAVESIRLRSIATQQAKRNTPIVDEDRPVSDRYQYSERRNYEAEMDADLDPLPYEEEERPPRRRIPGSRDERSTRDDYYEDQTPRRSERRNSRERPEVADKRRRPSSGRPVNRPTESNQEENWGSTNSREVDDWDSSGTETKRNARGGNNRPQRPENREDNVTPRPRRRRPPADSAPRREREDDEAIPTEYVPYNPIEKLNDEPDNSTDFNDDI
ncbi:Ycf66 family protein [Cylindrospermum sp. FACHB-282]|uniref:Ycf66 family protein n=1 Tax=Cylindrospermum sp. FACHB-282 TaxID=2692794 RepID=UPI00168233F4|nr:Ycf66 family protein [Cylindrospermum sp. FACHB-282]MBD2385661.1 Ycf66 family protein [Cylindrospermum sp. FACHB-282]